jgi:cytochrome c oxidase assembly protein Cox11
MTVSFRALGAATVVGVLLVGSGPAAGRETSRARGSLANTGLDADASGSVQWSLGPSRSAMTIATRGLDAGTYTVRVDGVPEGSLVSTGRSARARFTTSATPGLGQALDFDPRGKEIEIGDDGGGALRVEVSGTNPDSPGTTLEERTSITPTGAAPTGGKAEAHFRLRRDGRKSFEVQLRGVPNGAYQIFVDGVDRGTILVVLGRGTIEFDSADPPEPVLDFDPRGVTLDVAQSGTVLFSGPFAAQSPGVNVCDASQTSLFLTPTAAGAGGKAELRFRTRSDCEKDFQVEIEDVPAGPYDVLVNEAVVGSITAAADPVTGEIDGEIEFDTDADDPDELPLSFDPANAMVEIRQGAALYFSGVADPSNPPPATCTPEETNVVLDASGVQPSASGNARLRLRDDCEKSFHVEIEDVAAGSYELVVGGVARVTITAVLDTVSSGVRGQIEFSTQADQAGELPLDFDPAGQTVEVTQGGTTVLSSVLSGGTPGGGPTSCVESVTELPLLNVGPDPDARAEARLRTRDDCRQSFRVQIENVADGSYELVVGGTIEGTIDASLGQGEIEFDSDDPPKPLLDFDPSGQQIQVRQGGTTFVERLFSQ